MCGSVSGWVWVWMGGRVSVDACSFVASFWLLNYNYILYSSFLSFMIPRPAQSVPGWRTMLYVPSRPLRKSKESGRAFLNNSRKMRKPQWKLPSRYILYVCANDLQLISIVLYVRQVQLPNPTLLYCYVLSSCSPEVRHG